MYIYIYIYTYTYTYVYYNRGTAARAERGELFPRPVVANTFQFANISPRRQVRPQSMTVMKNTPHAAVMI